MRTRTESNGATARITALRNRATRYEVAVAIDGHRYRLGYLLRVSRASLLDLARTRGDAIVARARLTDLDGAAYDRATGWRFGDRVRIFRTGRTQRAAILEGELPELES